MKQLLLCEKIYKEFRFLLGFAAVSRIFQLSEKKNCVKLYEAFGDPKRSENSFYWSLEIHFLTKILRFFMPEGSLFYFKKMSTIYNLHEKCLPTIFVEPAPYRMYIKK